MRSPVPRPQQLPPGMPHGRDNLFRRLCRGVLRLRGWGLAGEFPDCPKLVVIVAPHSSWWDGVWGLFFKVGMAVNIAFVVKREAFVGPLGWLLRRLGGIALDRSAAHGAVAQMTRQFDASEHLWLAITPEGTRKHVDRWKSGYWRIARAAGVPMLLVYFDYPSRTVGVGPLLQPLDDLDADMARLREFYAPYRGKHRGVD